MIFLLSFFPSYWDKSKTVMWVSVSALQTKTLLGLALLRSGRETEKGIQEVVLFACF